MALADESMQVSVLLLTATICAETHGQTKTYNCGRRQNKTHLDQSTWKHTLQYYVNICEVLAFYFLVEFVHEQEHVFLYT